MAIVNDVSSQMSPSDSDLCCSDEELRKKYDLYGEDGLKDDHFGGGQNYQSWHYFNEEFGKTNAGFSNFALLKKYPSPSYLNGHTFNFKAFMMIIRKLSRWGIPTLVSTFTYHRQTHWRESSIIYIRHQ